MIRSGTILALAAILIVAGNVAAQDKTNFEHLQPFMGHWAKDGRMMYWEGQWYPFDQRTACSPAVGGDSRCSIPLDKMRPFFHPRMLAWQQFAGLTDERLSGMFECAPTPMPSLLEDGWTVRPLSEGLMRARDPEVQEQPWGKELTELWENACQNYADSFGLPLS